MIDPTKKYVLYSDGGYGVWKWVGSWAFIIVDEETGDEIVKGTAVSRGQSTNNMQEYAGVVNGMERALEMGIKRLKVMCDSQVIIKQLTGEYRTKREHLVPFNERGKYLAKCFDECEFKWVERENPYIVKCDAMGRLAISAEFKKKKFEEMFK